MNRAMFSGVSGLKSHQTKMDVIGNNIANVNTFGYKSQRAVFSDIYYQNLRSASAGSASRGGTNPSSVGYGSSLAAVQAQMNQSSMQNTGFGLDVAIAGEGFLQVMDPDGNIFYTKAGMLDYDANGYLTDINGNFVLGGTDINAAPGSQKIKLDNVGSVDSKIPKTEVTLGTVTYTLTAENTSSAGNINLAFTSSEKLPAGMQANASIASTGGITVTLNANEKFSSMEELNDAINSAILQANNGTPIAAGKLTLTANKNVFGKDAVTGSFIGKALAKPGSIAKKGAAAGDPLMLWGDIAEVTSTDIKKWPNVDTDMSFVVQEESATPTTDNLKITTTVNGETYSALVAKNAIAGTEVTLTSAGTSGGTIKLMMHKPATELAATIIATPPGNTDNKLTAKAPVTFLGGASLTAMGSNFSKNGKPTFSSSLNADASIDVTAKINGVDYKATVPANGGPVTFKLIPGVAGDEFTMTFPSQEAMRTNMAMEALAIPGAPTQVELAALVTALNDSAKNHTYELSRAEAAMTTPLTGAQIANDNFGTELGKLEFGKATLFDGAMKFIKAGIGFSGAGDMDFESAYTPETDGVPAFWTINATAANGKKYTTQITKDMTSSSVLLKSTTGGSEDFIQMDNPTFDKLSAYYQKIKNAPPTLAGDAVDGVGNGKITAIASKPSQDLGFRSTSWMLAGGTLGGTITLDQLTNIAIGTDGTITVTHPEKGTLVAGKIALANFANTSGLQLSGTSYYAQSSNSGDPVLCDPGTKGAGALKANSLEMSNVDLSNEFADMITTQRGFQANSRIITISDTMMEELINLKR